MILTIDVGNSAIEFGFFKNGVIVSKFRTVTNKNRTKDEYLVTVSGLLQINGVDPKEVKGAIIASVVPELNIGLTNVIKMLFKIEPIIVKAGIKSGVKVVTDNPQEVGADLVVGVAGALRYNKQTFVVVDLGTATTFTVVDDKNTIKGVAISTGIRLSLDALIGQASQLKTFELKTPKSVIGTNTTESLQAGVVIGHAAMIEGMIERIEKELGKPVEVILTGGLSDLIRPSLNRDAISNKNLLLEGLYDIYEKQQI